MGRPSKVFLAIEGGGSRGRAAISWGSSTVARSLPGGLNPNDIGPRLLERRLRGLILPLLRLPPSPIGSLRVLAALAGAGRPAARRGCADLLRAILEPRATRLRLKVTSDADALLERFFSRRDGIVLIAGTGSICLGVGRTRQGRVVARSGGWGAYLDGGCGFRLGLCVLDWALRALDGRAEGTLTTDLLCKDFDLRLDQVPEYFLPVRREQVADLARLALDACSRGDPVARAAVRETVKDLVDMVRTVAARLTLEAPPDVVISGGLFEDAHVSRSFRRAIKLSLPRTTLIHVADPLACLGVRPEAGR